MNAGAKKYRWLLLLSVLYQSLGFIVSFTLRPSRVLGCGLHDLELSLFDIHEGQRLLTPNEWLARHSSPVLDLLCAGPYGAYLVIMVLHYAYLASKRPDDARLFARIAFGTHLLGFITYIFLPAAPPWYVRDHGCAIDLAMKNSPAALARVDALLGVSYFGSMYGRGSVVFGALPSLHVTYPLYGLLATRRTACTASLSLQLAYALLMPFAAVYLGHHYVLDVVLGLAYVAVVFVVVLALDRFQRRGGSIGLRGSLDLVDGPIGRAPR